MKIIEITALENGAHRNQSYNAEEIPEGWAVIPDDMELLNFPFGEVVAEEVTHYREAEIMKDVVKTREVVNDAGETVTEEYTDLEPVIEQQPYTIMTVTGWTPLPIPEPEPKEIQITETEQLRADVDYIAMEMGVEL